MKTTGYMKKQHTPGLVEDDDEVAFVLVTHSPPRHHFPVSSYMFQHISKELKISRFSALKISFGTIFEFFENVFAP